MSGEYDWRTFEADPVETCMNCGLEESEHEPMQLGCPDFPPGYTFVPWVG